MSFACCTKKGIQQNNFKIHLSNLKAVVLDIQETIQGKSALLKTEKQKRKEK